MFCRKENIFRCIFWGACIAIIWLCFILENSTVVVFCTFFIVVNAAYVVPLFCRKYEVYIIPSSLRFLYAKTQEKKWSKILMQTTWLAWLVILFHLFDLLNVPQTLNEMQVVTGTITKIERGKSNAIPYFDIRSIDGNMVRLSFFGIPTRLAVFNQIKQEAGLVKVWFAKELRLYGRSGSLWVKQIKYKEIIIYKYSLKKHEDNYFFAKNVITISALYAFCVYALLCRKYYYGGR